MQISNSQLNNQEIFKKLIKKSELCRYCHSELKEQYVESRNWKEFLILVLSVFLIALVNLYYRKVLDGEYILLLIWILPLATTIIQGLDHIVFKWTYKIAKHESAVAIWGNWIREADFLEKQIPHHENSTIINEKMKNIQERYNICMSNTEQIPNNKFLEYKKKFKIHILKSREIDDLSLEDINGKK